MTLSGVAYLSCPPPGHQLRPQGPGPGPELPAGAGTVGPCSGWWRYWRRKGRVRLQDGLPLAPDHICVDSHISLPKKPTVPTLLLTPLFLILSPHQGILPRNQDLGSSQLAV